MGLPIRACRRVLALALSLAFLVPAVPCRACFSIVVGKDASADGCVLVGHNEDDEPPQVVNHHKITRRQYPPGTRVRLRNGGSLEQAEQTWACLWSEMPEMLFSDSYVNEWGVTVTSDNCPSREDKPQLTDGGIGAMLRRLVAERARTAREGVRLAGSLVERFGYVDSGRTYIIADPNEGWLLCVVNGKHWLARRVPDGEVAMVANTYTIRQVDIDDKDNVLASADIVDYAKSRGWYAPKPGGPFDFAAAYANPAAAANPNNTGRQWSGLSYVAQVPLKAGSNLPFSVVPRHKLSVDNVMQILRHDNESDAGQQPVNGPAAVTPAPADTPFGCALCSGATQTSFVAQLRATMPRDIGIVYWVCLASPRTSFYLPFHFGIRSFPAGFRGDSERPTAEVYARKVRAAGLNPLEAFWMYSSFREQMTTGPAAVAMVRARSQMLEQDAIRVQRAVEEAATGLYEEDEETALSLLENYSRGVYLSSLEVMHDIMHGPGR